MSSPAILRNCRAAALATLTVLAGTPFTVGATPIDQLDDLSGRASATLTLKTRDNFSNQFEYDVTVRNLTSDPLDGDSLIVVVDRISDLAGKDATDRIEAVGVDGYTNEGKPYYRVPVKGKELPPYGESQPARVRLQNPYYTILFTPSVTVRGRRSPQQDEPESVTTLLDLLIQKGVMTPDEGVAIRRRSPSKQSPP